jgi:hypothetical protein
VPVDRSGSGPPPGQGGAPAGWTTPPRRVLLSFSGPVTPMMMAPGTTYYRVVGAGSVPTGSWWVAKPPTSADRAGLAMKGSWNSMTGVVAFTPAVGAVIRGWHGAAAPQPVIMPGGRPGYLPGGSDVIWLPWGALSNDQGVFTIRPMSGSAQ